MKPIFEGAATALITPTTESGVDYDALGRLLDWQIAEGIDAICVNVTTSESASLSDKESQEVIDYSVQRIAGRVPVVAGTGSNDTAHAIEMTKFACSHGADACLTVTPYYNKCTQEGLVRSFSAIADASTKPLIIYNVPSRTGLNIQPSTYDAMADHPNIAAIKEANGNISEIAQTARLIEGRMTLYSGNDDQIIPIMSLGGKGVISVLSNCMPGRTSRMVHKWLDGDIEGALRDQMELLPLCNALFWEVNPIPVKAAMSDMGYCANFMRLPLTPMTPARHEALREIMRGLGLIS